VQQWRLLGLAFVLSNRVNAALCACVLVCAFCFIKCEDLWVQELLTAVGGVSRPTQRSPCLLIDMPPGQDCWILLK
jgi:hypothetical protein